MSTLQIDVEASQQRLTTINIIGWFGARTQINLVLGPGTFNQEEITPTKQSFSRSLVKKRDYFFQQLTREQYQLVVWSPGTAAFSATPAIRLFRSLAFDSFYQRIRSQLKILETGVLTRDHRLVVARVCAKKELAQFIRQCQSKYRISFAEALELVEELVPELQVTEVMAE